MEFLGSGREERTGRIYLRGSRFPFRVMKICGTRQRWLHNIVKALPLSVHSKMVEYYVVWIPLNFKRQENGINASEREGPVLIKKNQPPGP